MTKTAKFSISMPSGEFKALEAARRKAGVSRSQYVRDAALKTPDIGQEAEVRSVKEDRGAYGTPSPLMEDRAELKRRAIAAAGRFESGITNISVEHDRFLTEPEAPEKNRPR